MTWACDCRACSPTPGCNGCELSGYDEAAYRDAGCPSSTLCPVHGTGYLPPAVRLVACPRCGAPPGERCRSLGLPNHRGGATFREAGTPVAVVHKARRRALDGPAS